jgi:hypothetical protein
MIERVLRIKWFLGSTIERIEEAMGKFLGGSGLCPGNYVDLMLWKFGDVYQVALVYAEVIPAEGNNNE